MLITTYRNTCITLNDGLQSIIFAKSISYDTKCDIISGYPTSITKIRNSNNFDDLYNLLRNRKITVTVSLNHKSDYYAYEDDTLTISLHALNHNLVTFLNSMIQRIMLTDLSFSSNSSRTIIIHTLYDIIEYSVLCPCEFLLQWIITKYADEISCIKLIGDIIGIYGLKHIPL